MKKKILMHLSNSKRTRTHVTKAKFGEFSISNGLLDTYCILQLSDIYIWSFSHIILDCVNEYRNCHLENML